MMLLTLVRNIFTKIHFVFVEVLFFFCIFEIKKMDLSKKFTVVQKGDNPALGNFVHYYLNTNHIESSKVCS